MPNANNTIVSVISNKAAYLIVKFSELNVAHGNLALTFLLGHVLYQLYRQKVSRVRISFEYTYSLAMNKILPSSRPS